MPPARTAQIEAKANRQIVELIRQEGVCLANELKMRLELCGVYQDFTGRRLFPPLLSEHQMTAHRFQLTGQTQQSTYFSDPKLPDADRQKIAASKISAYEQIISMLGKRSHVGDFFEALTYISLVTIRQSHPQLQLTLLRPRDQIDKINEQQYAFDDFLMMRIGNYGVQVKNTIQMFTPTSADLSDFFQAVYSRAARPILVNRLSSIDLKKMMLSYRGRTLDTKTAYICTENNPEFSAEPLKLLGIHGLTEEIPHLIEIRDEKINGTEFFESRHYDAFTFAELADSAKKNVPPIIMSKMKGLFACLAASSFVDIASMQLEHKAEAMIGAILATQAIDYLLRSGGRQTPVPELVSHGAKKIRPPFNFHSARMDPKDLGALLVARLQILEQMGFVGEHAGQKFAVVQGMSHPEEWLTSV